LLLVQTFKISDPIIGRPPAFEQPSGRPLQRLYQLQAQAARDGWTGALLREAGNLWWVMGDLTRAVAYWEAVPDDRDVRLLRDRAAAYVSLGRWADASDALERMLALLPPEATDRPWASYQLGLIRTAYDPQLALYLLRAAHPTYAAETAGLVAVLESTHDPVLIGLALARAKLWSHAELVLTQAVNDPLALAYGGLARDMQGKDGSNWLQTALALAPDSAQVRYLQGLHLRLNYQYEASLQAIIQAVALDPENPALYAELGRAYQLVGDLPAAERWLIYAVGLDAHFQPLLDSFYNDEQTLLRDLGLIDEAALPFNSNPDQ
jgi:tetratricopeptide (TPR) repeat protein